MLTLKQIHAIADHCPFNFMRAVHGLAPDDDGFLGYGGDLTTSTLLHAYRSGVFPWFSVGEPICWWSPTPRCVINPTNFHPKKSLIRTVKKQTWHITTNLAFDQVIYACSQPRNYSNDTWITKKMINAYGQLHELGVAVSIEVWQNIPIKSELIGGLYGINIGAVFCGESMFHRQTDASKVAFWAMAHWCWHMGITLIDCQLENTHLMNLGAQLIPRDDFINELNTLVHTPVTGLGGRKLSAEAVALI